MQIYVVQAGQKSGPFSEEQVQSMLQSGMLSETTPVWREGMVDWRPLNEVFNFSSLVISSPSGGGAQEVFPKTPPPPPFGFEQTPRHSSHTDSLRDRSEQLAKGVCITVSVLTLVVLLVTGVGLVLLPLLLIQWLFSFLSAAYLKAGAVLISPQSWPELHKVVEETKAKLKIREANAYVVQDSVFNAFAIRLAGRNFVILNSGAVDALLRKGKLEDLKFLVGHECGHVALGHVSFLGGVLPGLCMFFSFPLYAWYRRCQERSADRCGLWSAGNRTDAHRSIAVLAGGSEMGSRLNVHAVTDQWNALRDEFWITVARFLSEYPHMTERVLLVHQAADEFRLP